jgi:hypothetical protein
MLGLCIMTPKTLNRKPSASVTPALLKPSIPTSKILASLLISATLKSLSRDVTLTTASSIDLHSSETAVRSTFAASLRGEILFNLSKF